MNDAMTQLQTNQPVPVFEWSQDRDTFIQIYTIKNEARNTYTVITSNMGQILFMCPSIGFPIPADTQLTNPLKTAYVNSSAAVIEQAEPNGLYSSKNTVGTYVLCVRDNGDIVPVYTENNANTFMHAVSVGPDGVLQDVEGSPSAATIEIGE
jgi:hypothetical protein